MSTTDTPVIIDTRLLAKVQEHFRWTTRTLQRMHAAGAPADIISDFITRSDEQIKQVFMQWAVDVEKGRRVNDTN